MPSTQKAEFALMMANILSEIVSQTDVLVQNQVQGLVTLFQANKSPGISIKEYLIRVMKYSHCSDACFILALIYLDRITEHNSGFIISSLNVHRLIITSIMIAAKFYDDQYFDNNYYARVGGITNSELNILELEFLKLIRFSLFVHPLLYERYQGQLLDHIKVDLQQLNNENSKEEVMPKDQNSPQEKEEHRTIQQPVVRQEQSKDTSDCEEKKRETRSRSLKHSEEDSIVRKRSISASPRVMESKEEREKKNDYVHASSLSNKPADAEELLVYC